MSLRYQINIRILISFLCILLIGCSITIWKARDAVNKEVESSINLAVQLINFGFSQTPLNETDWLPKLNSLNKTRHLNIQLKEPSGQIISIIRNTQKNVNDELPPQWFINVLAIHYPKVEHQILRANGEQITLIIQANPLDEITEVWQESIDLFYSLVLLTLLTFLTVNLAFNKAIRPITVIVDALKLIETGQYQKKLPDFSILEYNIIARAINRMADELNTSQQKNRALTQHTLGIQEDERQRLSQELHDELAQSLTAIKVMAVTAGRSITKTPETNANIKQATDSIITTSDHLMTVVRSMMHQLHPLMLSDLGLKATMEDLLNHWTIRNTGLKLTINCPDEVDNLKQKTAIQIFRVVQECLTNIVRHAQATQATVSLKIEHQTKPQKTLRLLVIDNGQGCAIDKIKTGFGLLGMKERINSLSGELTLQSQPKQGMSIIATIPLP